MGFTGLDRVNAIFQGNPPIFIQTVTHANETIHRPAPLACRRLGRLRTNDWQRHAAGWVPLDFFRSPRDPKGDLEKQHPCVLPQKGDGCHVVLVVNILSGSGWLSVRSTAVPNAFDWMFRNQSYPQSLCQMVVVSLCVVASHYGLWIWIGDPPA